jgi:hypothetical protein
MEQNQDSVAYYSPEVLAIMKEQYEKYIVGLTEKAKRGEELTEQEQAAIVQDYLQGMKQRADKMVKDNPIFEQLKGLRAMPMEEAAKVEAFYGSYHTQPIGGMNLHRAQEFLNACLPKGTMFTTAINKAVLVAMIRYASYHVEQAAEKATTKDELDYNFRDGGKYATTVVDKDSILAQKKEIR